jgi:hypothetical protein
MGADLVIAELRVGVVLPGPSITDAQRGHKITDVTGVFHFFG